MNSPAADGSPLISVIVPTFNSQDFLARALQSLALQTWRDFEVVLRDGASGDGTVGLAESFAGRLPALHIESRVDRSVYDAINGGVAAARGQWCLVLGSDDCLHAADTLARAAASLQTSAASMVYGDVRMMADNGHRVPPGGRYAGAMPLARLLRANICQQAIFYRRTLFDELGGFRLDLPVMADWDFNLRVAFRHPTQWLDQVISDYAATGMSARSEDPAAEAAIPELIRAELLARAADRSTWRLQRVLLRQADKFRRKRRWRALCRHVASYVYLLGCRLAIVVRRG